MSLPIDRTSKSALDGNLVNGNTSDAPVIKNSNDVVYNTIDELNSKVDGLVGSSALSPYPSSFLSRQAFINGNCDIWQRGNSFTNPVHNSYTADRFQVIDVPDGGTNPAILHTRQQLNSGELLGSNYFYRINTNGAGSAYGINAQEAIQQPIENGVRLLCGLGKKITLSFWSRSSLNNKKIGIYAQQNYGSGGTPSNFDSLSGTYRLLTTAWQKFTVTFNALDIASRTFGTNNDDRLYIRFYSLWGSAIASLVGDTVAEGWGGTAYVDITKIQVNDGSAVLPFQPKSFADELISCQRYYRKTFPYSVAPANGTGNLNGSLTTRLYGSTEPLSRCEFPISMRIAPTVTLFNPRAAGATGQWSNGTVDSANARSFQASENSAIVDNADTVLGTGFWSIHVTADAEF